MAKLKKNYKKALEGNKGDKGVFDKKDAKALNKYYIKKEGLSKKKAKKKSSKVPLGTKLQVKDSFRKKVGKPKSLKEGRIGNPNSDAIKKAKDITNDFSEGRDISNAAKKGKFSDYISDIKAGAEEQYKLNSRAGLMKPQELKVSYKDKDFDTNYSTRLNKDGMLSKNKDGSDLKIASAPTAPTRITNIRDSRSMVAGGNLGANKLKSKMNNLASSLKGKPSAALSRQSSREELIAKGKKRTGR